MNSAERRAELRFLSRAERTYELLCSLDDWASADPGERAYEISRTQSGWLVRMRSDRNGLLTEQTEKPTKADALASAAMIVTHNPYLE